MTSLVDDLSSGGPLTESAVTMPEVWRLTDKDNSVYLENTKYPELLQQFKEDTFRIQNQVRLIYTTFRAVIVSFECAQHFL